MPYLKFFTFLDRAAIERARGGDARAPEKREAQRALAREVTTLVHGDEQLARAEHASALLFGEDIATLPSRRRAGRVRRRAVDGAARRASSTAKGMALVDLVVRTGLAPSKGEARRLVQSGGVYVNDRRVADAQRASTPATAIGGRLFVLRKGQKQNHLVRLT